MARLGTNCRCRCGCTIWVGPSKGKNEDICRWCAGYTVFGKDVEPKHNGEPDTEARSGGRPMKKKVVCAKCRVPVQLLYGRVVHETKYYLWDQHEVEAVL